VVVHDPCPLRLESGIQTSVRTLLAAQGLEVRKMKHSGKRTLCCGEGGGVGFHNPGFAKAWGEKRKKLAGDDRIVTYCAGCAGFLGRIASVSHLGEVLFEQEKALAGKSKVAKAPLTYVNRLLLKRRLGKMFIPS
jgi:Fe-S oxidoreductase